MNYFSIDIETTGLNPDMDQVLQIGAVYAPDRLKDVPVEMLPTFNVLVQHERYEGDPFALALNAALLQRLANKEGVSANSALDQFIHWIIDVAAEDNKDRHVEHRRYTMAGKNVASFDRQFLKRIPAGGRTFDRMFHHRSIDPAVWYYQDGDRELPGTEKCISRLILEQKLDLHPFSAPKHDAVNDARTVVRLIRGRMGGLIA